MALMEDDRPQRKPRHQLGQELAALSVDELKTRIGELQTEIARIEAEMKAKGATKSAAEALFSRGA